MILDGKCLREEEACLPINDRGFLFGDGVFTTLRVCDGKVEFIELHLERLKQQCLQLNIIPPPIPLEWLGDLIKANQAIQGIWRLKIIVTGGNDPVLRLPKRKHGHLVMTLQPYSIQPLTPCRLCLYPEPIHRPVAALKTLSYLDRLCVYEYAQQKGFDDAIVRDGHLLETAFSNLFWIVDNQFFAPDESLPYFKGIILNELKKNFTFQSAENIPKNSHVFICNSLIHFRPVIEIEGNTFSRQPQLEEIIYQKIKNLV